MDAKEEKITKKEKNFSSNKKDLEICENKKKEKNYILLDEFINDFKIYMEKKYVCNFQ
jgi:hypothetical protein